MAVVIPARSRTIAFDMAAIGVSGLCLVHCLAPVALAAALPLAGLSSGAAWLHATFAAAAVPLSLAAFLGCGRARRSWLLAGLAALGLAALIVGAAGWPGHDWETPLTVCGGLMLVLAHGLNMARRRP